MNNTVQDFYLSNYHTHTERCMHAKGSEEDFVRRAIQNGFRTFGFADHSPWPYRSSFVANMRMRESQLSDYVSTIRRLRDKYADQIEIHIGLECEAFPEYFPWLRGLKDEGIIEYFILGNHYDTTDEFHTIPYFGNCRDTETIERYVQTTIAGMESGLFSYVCHPDLYLNRYPKFDAAAEKAAHALCEAAERLNLPLEYNLLGMNRNPASRKEGNIGYTSDEFWNVASKYNIRAIIGIDAHLEESLDCVDTYRSVRGKLSALGIPVIEKIDF